MGKHDLIIPEEDGYSDTNSPLKKDINKKKGYNTYHLTTCRRVGFFNDTVYIKLSISASYYSVVYKAISKNQYWGQIFTFGNNSNINGKPYHSIKDKDGNSKIISGLKQDVYVEISKGLTRHQQYEVIDPGV